MIAIPQHEGKRITPTVSLATLGLEAALSAEKVRRGYITPSEAIADLIRLTGSLATDSLDADREGGHE
jgi:hypothetical protein